MAVIGTAYGGTAPYNYAWVGPVSANIPVISMGNVTTAAAGTYTLTVTDANGCVSTDVTTAVVNQTPTITTQPQVTQDVCAGTTWVHLQVLVSQLSAQVFLISGKPTA